MSAAKKGDVEYWHALRHEIDNGGREAFLYDMLNYPLGEFFPQRDVLRFNEEHRRMIEECRDHSTPRAWLEECIACEELKGVTLDELGTPVYWTIALGIPGSKLLDGYRKWVSGLKGFGIRTASANAFWRFLTKIGCEVDRTNSQNVRRVPSPQECSERLKKV